MTDDQHGNEIREQYDDEPTLPAGVYLIGDPVRLRDSGLSTNQYEAIAERVIDSLASVAVGELMGVPFAVAALDNGRYAVGGTPGIVIVSGKIAAISAGPSGVDLDYARFRGVVLHRCKYERIVWANNNKLDLAGVLINKAGRQNLPDYH